MSDATEQQHGNEDEVVRVARAMAEHAGFSWDHCAQSQWCGDARVAIAAMDGSAVMLTDNQRHVLERMAAHDPRDPGMTWSDNLLLIESAAQAAKDGLAAMGGQWRDISTAPRDGTKFIIGRDASKHHPYSGIAVFHVGRFRDPTETVTLTLWVEPTHWMPLPPAPVTP